MPSSPPPFRSERLPSGFRTVVVEMPSLHQVQVSLYVPVGSRYERPAECGASHFVEHVVFRGTEDVPDGEALNRAFENVGGMLNAHTGVEFTEYDCTVHPAHLDEALRLLCGVVRAPTFAEVEKERRILLDELSYDYNEQGHLVNLGTLSSQLMWPGHALGQSVGGVPETISALDEAQLRAHHRAHYHPARMVLALAGAVPADAALESARRHFGSWASQTGNAPGALPAAAPAPARRRNGPHLQTVHDADNQIHLQLSFPAPSYNDPDELAMALLARTLDDGPTSRLQRVLREEQALVYAISAAHTGYWDTGSLDVVTSVRPDALDTLLRELLRVLAEVRDRGPTPDELERARLRYLFDLDYDRDSPGARSGRYAWPLLYSTVRDDETERLAVQALRLEGEGGLNPLAGRVLARDGLHAVLVGPVDDAIERKVAARLAEY